MRKMEQKNRILIVEDDTDINNLLYTALQKAGYETVQAFSGTEERMLFQMDKAGFSLILLDLMLPGISGEEVLARIQVQLRHKQQEPEKPDFFQSCSVVCVYDCYHAALFHPSDYCTADVFRIPRVGEWKRAV